MTAEYRPIGAVEPPDNLGITAFSVNSQLDSGGQVQIFSRLQNSGLTDKQVGISLYVGDELEDARSVLVPGRETSKEFLELGDNDRIANIEQSTPGDLPLNFDLTGLASTLDTATPIRLVIDDQDVYMLDNEAHCVLNPTRLARVLIVTDYNKPLEFAVATDRMKKIGNFEFADRDYLKDKIYQDNAALGIYDLILYDQCVPDVMPACNTIFINAMPKSENWSVKEKLETTPIIYTNSNHPIMFDVQMGNVNILEGNVINGPIGSSSLVDSVGGSVMKIGPRLGFEDLVIGFPMIVYEEDGDTTINTDWQKHPSFPFFMQNVVIVLGTGSRFDAMKSNQPGQAIKLKPLFPFPEIDVKNPAGEITRVKANDDTSFMYAQTDQSGVYEVRETGSQELDQLFAVNLLDRLESDLGVRDELKLGYEAVAGQVSSEPARKNFWTWLVLAALFLITIEWFIYNRRVLI
ncbi:MAG: hypothetical protein ACI814_004895 [Mariniblastus sp.]